MDGTVLNTLPTITYFMDRTLVDFGLSPIGEENCRRFVGNGARILMERVFDYLGLDQRDTDLFEKIYRAYKEGYDAEPLYLTEPYPGILPLLSSLRDAGIGVGIVSNKPHTAVLPLSRYFFGDLVGEVQGAADDLPLKPDPAVVRTVMHRLGGTERFTAYIGDSEVDVATGRALGAGRTVGVLWGFRDREKLSGADLLVSRADEILPIALSL